MKAERWKIALLLSLLLHLLLLQRLVDTTVPEYRPRGEYAELLNIEPFEGAGDSAPTAGLLLSPRPRGEEHDRFEEGEIPLEVVEEPPPTPPIEDMPDAGLTVLEPGAGQRSQQIIRPALLGDDSAIPIPDSLRETTWEGAVTLEIFLDYDGAVLDVRVMRTSGREDADMAAVYFYRNTRWTPLMIDGRPYQGPRQVVVEKTVEFTRYY